MAEEQKKNPYRRRKPMTNAHKAAATEGRRRARAAREAKAAAELTAKNPLWNENDGVQIEGHKQIEQQGATSENRFHETQAIPEGVVPPRQSLVSAENSSLPEPEHVSESQEAVSELGELAQIVKQLQQQMDETRRENAELLRKINSGEVEKTQLLEHIAGLPGSGATVGINGVQGQVFKYPVEKSYYPDPTDRLYDDPKLRRFAMRENFYFKWDVEAVEYEKHNVHYAEPRFKVELWRYMFDSETGESTGRMFLISRQIQHEDEFIARITADRMGIAFDSVPELLDEMRYQRIRQWLLGVFTPYKINQHRNKITQMVVGGKVVEVKDTEQLTDSQTGKDRSASVNDEVKLTPAETREAIKNGLFNS